MTPEEEKILREDGRDLYNLLEKKLRDYIEETSFHLKDKAALLALSNLVGNFFNGYTREKDKDNAIDVFIDIVTKLMQGEVNE